MCIGRAAADGAFGGCGADDADHRVERQAHFAEQDNVVVFHRHDIDAPAFQPIAGHACAGQGGEYGLFAQFDAADVHAQGIARLGAFHKQGAGGGIDAVPVEIVESVGSGLDLVGEAVAGFKTHAAARCGAQHGGIVGRHGEYGLAGGNSGECGHGRYP